MSHTNMLSAHIYCITSNRRQPGWGGGGGGQLPPPDNCKNFFLYVIFVVCWSAQRSCTLMLINTPTPLWQFLPQLFLFQIGKKKSVRMRVCMPRYSTRCNIDGRSTCRWTAGETMLKNKSYLVNHSPIIVSL